MWSMRKSVRTNHSARSGALASLAAVAVLVGPTGGPPAAAVVDDVVEVSVSSAEVPADGPSGEPDMSADGRYVAFTSTGDNLAGGDSNGDSDVFLRDTVTGTTRVVSKAGPAWGNGPSYAPSLSDDGSVVVFLSEATNLSPRDADDTRSDAFATDMLTGTVTWLGAASWAEVSGNGRYVVTSTGWRSFRFDRQTGVVVPVPGKHARISDSGRHVVTLAQDSSGRPALRYTDLAQGTARNLLAKALGGWQPDAVVGPPVISGPGRYVAFATDVPRLVRSDTDWSMDIYVIDTVDGRFSRASAELNRGLGAAGPDPAAPSLSDDGRVLAFGYGDSEVSFGMTLDRATGLISIFNQGGGGNPSLDRTGRLVSWAMIDSYGEGVRRGAVPQCTIDGTGAADRLIGTSGSDVICGRGGDDVIEGRGGADLLAGGPGHDTLSFRHSTRSAGVHLWRFWARVGSWPDQARLEVNGFERVDGSPFRDTLSGTSDTDALYGLGGNDSLYGQEGDDRLFGGEGDDSMNGGQGTDLCNGGPGTGDVAYGTSCELVFAVP